MLERRALLASIQGTLWNDLNVNGIRDAGESGLAGRTVYLDLNRDGLLGAGEPSTLTAGDGSYSFTNLNPGPYQVAQVLPGGWQQTAPGTFPTRGVLLQASAQSTTFTFSSLGSTTSYDLPGAYSQSGYTFDTTAEGVPKFHVYGSTDTARYGGSAALTIASWPTTISLRRDDGAPFTIQSIKLAEIWNSVYTPTVTFKGTKSDGRVVQQTFTLDNVFNNTNAFQTFNFAGFDDIVSLDWFTHDVNDAHQFDDVAVTAGGTLDATGIDLGSVAQTPPDLTVRDYAAFEQNGGQYYVTFYVDLASANTLPVNVYYSTEGGGTATAGQDYTARSGRILFEPGATTKYVSILTSPDTVPEPDETILVNVWGAVNARIADGQARITLYNDDLTASNDTYTASNSAPLDVAAPGVLGNDGGGSQATAALVTGPQSGTLTLNPNGSFRYVPSAGFVGTATFTYRVQRTVAGLYGTTGSYTVNGPTATASISVSAANQAPNAVADAFSVSQNGVLSITAPGVLANDTDPEGQAMTAVLQTGPAHGALTLQSNGSFTYTPAAGYMGPDSFTYVASDGAKQSSPATVTLTVTRFNRVPVAGNDAYTLPEDTPLTVTAPAALQPDRRVLANDTDADGDPLSALLVAGPGHGTVTLNADGSFTYTPAANYNGPDQFTYKVNDGFADSNVATVALTISSVNDAPQATGDAYSTTRNTLLSVAAAGVLANDTDAEGDPLTAVLVAGPAHGTLTLNANGSFSYTPATGYTGPDSFTYKANDGLLDSAVATVSLTVAAPAGTVWTQRGGNAGHTSYVDVSINAATIGDAWNQPLSYVGTGTGSWAERAVAIDATHVYRTDLDGYAFDGTYHVIAYDLATGAVAWNRSITGNAFEGVGEPSVAGGIVYVNRAGHSGISGGTSADLPRLYGLSPQTGATVVQATYAAQWASNERPVIDSNQLVAWDGYYGGFSAWTASTLSRQWNNSGSIYDPPMAALDGQYVYAYGNQVYSRTTGARLADITHPLGLTPSAPIVSGSGRLLYTVAGSVNGQATQGVAAYGGTTHALLWTAYTPTTVGAKAVGNGVVAVTSGKQLILLDEATGAQIRTWQAPDNLTAEIVLTRTHAFVESSASGVARVYAVNLATGQSEWTFENRLTGETGSPYMEMALGGGYLLLSHDAFVRAIAVTAPANHAPVAANDTYTTPEDTGLTVAARGVLTNDTDGDGDPISAVLVSGPTHGTLALNPDGSFTYTPAAGYNGPDGFSYMANDGSLKSTVATVQLSVLPVNDLPVLAAPADRTLTAGSGPLTVPLSATDPDGDPLTYSAQAVTVAYALDQQLGLSTEVSAYQNYLGLGEKWLSSAGGTWYYLTPDGSLYRHLGGTSGALVQSLDPSYYADPSLLYNAQPGSPPATVGVSGAALTVDPAADFIGRFAVRVTVGDGQGGTDTRFFTVTVANRPPVLGAIADQTMATAPATLTVALSATDPDGDPLTYSAQAVTMAYYLDQQLGLSTEVSAYQNYLGRGEKWLSSASGTWYFIQPDGGLYRHLGGTSGALVEALDPSFYADPSRLYAAQPGAPAVAVGVAGSTLTVDPSAGFAGRFAVRVTASDGRGGADTRFFTVTVANRPPALDAIADQTMTTNQDVLSVPLSASDPDGDPLTYSGQAVTVAYALDQQLGLNAEVKGYEGYLGLGEKWLSSAGGTWYFITSDGSLYRHLGGTSGALVDVLDPSYYADPSLLYAAQPGAPAVAIGVAGSTLTVDPASGFVGRFAVRVTVADGRGGTNSRFFKVTVTA